MYVNTGIQFDKIYKLERFWCYLTRAWTRKFGKITLFETLNLPHVSRLKNLSPNYNSNVVFNPCVPNVPFLYRCFPNAPETNGLKMNSYFMCFIVLFQIKQSPPPFFTSSTMQIKRFAFYRCIIDLGVMFAARVDQYICYRS